MSKVSSVSKGDKVYFIVEDKQLNTHLREDVVTNIHQDGDKFFVITNRFCATLDMDDLGKVWDTNKKSLLTGVSADAD